MNKNEICEKIKGMLKKVLDEQKVLPSSFEDDISELLDSIEFVMLIVEIEDEYKIKFDDNDFEIENIDTIGKFAELVIKYNERTNSCI